MQRIGIFAGTFNPVHLGHVQFALQAAEKAKLDVVYFLPERRPRNKPNVEHFGHRVAMLRQACLPWRQLEVLELPDVSFTVRTTLPRLRSYFGDSAQLVLLCGSDVAMSMSDWPGSSRLLASTEIAVGVRDVNADDFPIKPQALHIIHDEVANVSSTQIRSALQSGKRAPGLLASVARYSNRHWLYVSLASK